MRVVFMGTPEFAVPALEHLILNQYQVVAVYTQPDKMAGRGRSLASSAVKRAAADLDVPVLQPVSLREQEAVAELTAFEPDVIVVAAFGQMLPQSVLNIPARGCVNIHPSLLPKFRGASPVATAILAGDEFTGVSIMLMDSGMDTGPVLSRAQIAISVEDTTGLLTTRLSLLAAPLLLEVLPGWFKGEVVPRPQDEAEATYSKILAKADGEIDWQLSAVDIWRRVRAFNPWPVCYTRWEDRQLNIIEAVPLPEAKSLEPGKVVPLNQEGVVLGVGTGAGTLGILTVQVAGKRAMSAAEFLRGHKQFIGARLSIN